MLSVYVPMPYDGVINWAFGEISTFDGMGCLFQGIESECI